MSAKSQKIRLALDLSERHREILELLATGMTMTSASMALGMTEKTLSYHISSLYQKTDLSSRAELTKLALRLGLAEIDV